MKKLQLVLLLTGGLWLSACSGEKTTADGESGLTSSEEATANDSSTTNPINSEYGTPNSSENQIDSAQSVGEGNNQ